MVHRCSIVFHYYWFLLHRNSYSDFHGERADKWQLDDKFDLGCNGTSVYGSRQSKWHILDRSTCYIFTLTNVAILKIFFHFLWFFLIQNKWVQMPRTQNWETIYIWFFVIKNNYNWIPVIKPCILMLPDDIMYMIMYLNLNPIHYVCKQLLLF